MKQVNINLVNNTFLKSLFCLVIDSQPPAASLLCSALSQRAGGLSPPCVQQQRDRQQWRADDNPARYVTLSAIKALRVKSQEQSFISVV